ncbi:dirigent protein 1-like [Miscanthus floridulus]|uniref:dirigent protein 1-like n=1 Tax=Miscanthus floridulus TaxID=154761 RepID=UPI00345828BE
MASLHSTIFVGAVFLLAAAVYFRSLDTAGGSSATTHLHFFMHDVYTGPHPTAARVVSGRSLLLPTASSDDVGANNDSAAAGTGRTLSVLLSSPWHTGQFGDVVVLNNALTEGPSGDSTRVAMAQGFTVRVSEGGIVSHLAMHMVLEAGEHRGSSVTANGRIDNDAKVRESAMIGDIRKFRFARGYMLTRNYDYDLAHGGVIEIDVYVQH